MTGRHRDPVDAHCHERCVDSDVEVCNRLGRKRWLSGCCHGQQDEPCVPLSLLRNLQRRICPCTLHVALGLVNALDEAMLEKVGAEVLLQVWYGPAQVSKSPYHGAQFEGNECRCLVSTAAAAGDTWKDDLQPFMPLFTSLNTLQDVAFAAREQLSDEKWRRWQLLSASLSTCEWLSRPPWV